MDVLSLAASQFYKQKKRPDGRKFGENAGVIVEHHKQLKGGLRSSVTVRYGGTVVTCTGKARLVHLHPYARPCFEDYFRITRSGTNANVGQDETFSPLADKICEILELSEAVDFEKTLTFTRPSGAEDVDMVDSSESATCKWIWRIFVDFYVIKSDGCILPASLLGVLLTLGDLQIPEVKIDGAYICDHTGVLADELEFDVKPGAEKNLVSIDPNEMRRVTVPLESILPTTSQNLDLKTFPYAVCFAFIPKEDEEVGEKVEFLADPSGVEEALCCSTLTVVCSRDKIFHILTTGCGLAFSGVGKNVSGIELILCLVKTAQERAENLSTQILNKN